jgi:hypothetical protein
MLFMSVICDLQFNGVGVGLVFARLPIRPDVGALPQQVVGPSCAREIVTLAAVDHTLIPSALNQGLALNRQTNAIISPVLQN